MNCMKEKMFKNGAMALVFCLVAVRQVYTMPGETLGLDNLVVPDGILSDLKDASKIEELIRSQIPVIKSIMKTGDVENGIPSLDPYYQDDTLPNRFQVDVPFAEAHVDVDSVIVNGMSNFMLRKLMVSTNDKSISFALELPELHITGNYKADGILKLDGPVKLNETGPFKATVLRPTVAVFLNINYENNTGLSVSGSSVSVDYEDMDLELEGFMIGDPLRNIVLFSIKKRSRDFFEQSKEQLEERLSEFMSSTLNTIFDSIFNDEINDAKEPIMQSHVIEKRQACGSGNMNSYIDQVIKNARPYIRQKADPLRLKDLKKVVKLRDGKVTGLSSIRRTGNVVLGCTSSDINLSVDFGFSGIRAGYRWERKILFVKLKGKAEIKFRSLYVVAKISQPRRSGAHPVITKLDLKLKGISVRITGLSIAGHIIAAIISLISNIFRKAISNALEGPIRKALQKELNKVTLPF